MRRNRGSKDEVKILGQSFPLRRYADGRFVSWWYHGSALKRVTRTTESEIRKALTDVAIRVSNGELDANELTGSQARETIAARESLARWNVPVDVAARDYAAARAELPAGVSLLDAARFYRRYATELVHATVAEVVGIFLEAKTAKGVSEAYGDSITRDLARLVTAHGAKAMTDLTTADLASLIDTAGLHRVSRDPESGEKIRVFRVAGAHRRNGIRATLATLLNFARARKYLPQDRPTAIEGIDRLKAVSGRSPVLTPAELRTFLEATAEHGREWLPWLAIGAFSGMRTGAILRLDWSQVHWEASSIEVEAVQSKVAGRYLAPLHPVLATWLAPWRRARGAVACSPDPADPPPKRKRSARHAHYIEKLERWTAATWPKNALRASYISYRLAQVGDAAIVAGECNTSAAEVLKEYRDVRTIKGQLVTKALAEEWFNVLPATADNVVQATFRFG